MQSNTPHPNRFTPSRFKLAAAISACATLVLSVAPAAALLAEATAYATLNGTFNKQTVKDIRVFTANAEANAIRQNGNTLSTARARAAAYRHGTFLNKLTKIAIGQTFGNPNNWWKSRASTGAFVVVDTRGETGFAPVGFSLPSAGTPAEGSPVTLLDAAGNPFPTQTFRAGGTGYLQLSLSSTLVQGSNVLPLFDGGLELRGPASANPGFTTTGGLSGRTRSAGAPSGAAEITLADGIDASANAVSLRTGVVIENFLRINTTSLDPAAPVSPTDEEPGFEASTGLFATVEVVDPTGRYRIRSLTPGDANGDFRVTPADLAAAQPNFNQPTGSTLPRWAGGDWTQDGRVDADDLLAASPFRDQGESTPDSPEIQDIAAGVVVYYEATGRILLGVDPTATIDSFKIDSVSGIFSAAAPNLPGLSDFTTDSDHRVAQNFFAAPLATGLFDLGNVAAAGLSQEFVFSDLSALFGTTGRANQVPALIYVAIPEPSALGLLALPALALIRRPR